VKRPGLRVRSRSGFFGTTDYEDEPLTRRERMRDALYSPFESGTLPLRLTTMFSQAKDDEVYINALMHFETNQFAFDEEKDGWKKAVVDIVATTFDAKGEQVDLEARTWEVKARGETFEEMQKRGVVFLMRIPVKKSGAYQMRVAVSDTKSGLLGTATQFIEVPNLGKGHLALSGIALASEKRQLDAVEEQEGLIAGRDVNGTAAVRVFQPGDAIVWAYQILNAKSGSDGNLWLQTYVRLFSEGEEIYSAAPVEMKPDVAEGSERLIGTGRMELRKIEPGEYSLQVIVMDMLAKEKNRVAVQFVNFEVQDSKLTLNRTGDRVR
jgi:hypothetical protein